MKYKLASKDNYLNKILIFSNPSLTFLDTSEISPRLSYLASSSVVRIKESNDAYGVLNLEPPYIVIDEENRKVNFTVQRTGMYI